MDPSAQNSNAADDAHGEPDPLSIVVRIDPAIMFSSRQTGGETSYVATDTRTGKFYRFGSSEYHAVTLMDGVRTLAEIHRQLDHDGVLWSGFDVLNFSRELTQHRLASIVPALPDEQPSQQPKMPPGGSPSLDPSLGSDAHSGSTVPSTPDKPRSTNQPSSSRQASWLGKTMALLGKLLSQRFPLADGDRVAIELLPLFGRCFSTPALFLWAILVASGVGVAWENKSLLANELSRVFDQQLWIVMAVVWCVLKVIHECAHATCAKSHGVRVGPMGIMFFLLAPLAYVDVTDAWKLVRRRDRCQIAMAGVYAELAIGALAAWAWYYLPTGFGKHLAAQVFFVAGPATILVNANPLLRLDGYYVLGDLLEIPNLRAHGRKRLVGLFERAFFRIPMSSTPLHGWRNDFALGHAFCSVVFQILWMSGLVFAVATWFRGLGIVLAIVAASLWAVVPIVKWMHKIWTLESSSGWILNFYQRRLLAFCSLIALTIQYAAVQTSPFARRVPVVIRYQDEQIARAPVDAFVRAVFVQCGDRVQNGDLLMELEQPELILKRDQLVDRRELAIARSVQHRRRSEIGLAKTAQQQADGLERQIEEVQQQIQSLTVVAERDGKITSPSTNQLLGRYAKRGDELVRVSDPQEKEILAIVAEDNLEAYKTAANATRKASVRLRGGVTISAMLAGARPSASRRLPHPALAATSGGPLAIQMTESSESPMLVHSHLESILPLDPLTSLEVEAGQIGRLTIPDDRTLITRLWNHLVEQSQPR